MNEIAIFWGETCWCCGRVQDLGARGPGFKTYLHGEVSLSKTVSFPQYLLVDRQEAVGPTQDDQKVIDWDVQP